MVTMELNKELFNEKYSIVGMTNNSIVIENKLKERLYVHRKVLNTILTSDKPIPCAIMPRLYNGKTNMWLATMFTF